MEAPWPRRVRDLPYNFDPALSIERHAAPDYVDSSDPPVDFSSEHTLDGQLPSSPPKSGDFDVDMDGDATTDDDEASGLAQEAGLAGEATLRPGSMPLAAHSESSLRHRTPAEIVNAVFDADGKTAMVDLANRCLRRVPVECRDLAVHVDLCNPRGFHLDLKNNAIGLVDRFVYKIERLDFLSLRFNVLTDLSPMVRRLAHLQELHLGHNHLETLPAELLQMPSLRILTTYPNPFLPPPEDGCSDLRWVEPVPSLMELARRALATTAKHDYSNVERLLRCVDSSLQAEIELSLEAAYTGRVCSVCSKLYVVPAAIHLEWKQHPCDKSGETVPFKTAFCTVGCVRQAGLVN